MNMASLPSSRNNRSAGIGTIKRLVFGCRGIVGPVPPPLWIRVPHGAIQLVTLAL